MWAPIRKHEWRLAKILITTVITYVVYQFYCDIKSPVLAGLAARQMEDSAATWALYHNLLTNNWGEAGIIFLGTFICIILLIPFWSDLIKAIKEGKQ